MADKKEYLSDFLLHKSSQAYGDNAAIISHGISLNYKCIHLLVKEAEKKLIAAGIKCGDYVAVLSPNSPEYVIISLALIKCGAVFVPVSNKFPVKIINSMLKGIACTKLILSSFLNDKNGLLQGSRGLAANTELEILSLEDIVSIPGIRHSNNFIVNKFDTEQHRESNLKPDRNATIIFSSGSSGNPKAVLHSYSSHIYSALGANQNIKFKSGDAWLLSLPMYHIGGFAIIIRAFISGGSVVIPVQGMNTQEALEIYSITHISLVSTQLYRLLKAKSSANKLMNLKAIILGGSGFSKNLIKRAVDLGLPVHTSYGSTEAASQITTTAEKDKVENLNTSGKVLKYRQIKIGSNSEILIKGKTLCKGYVDGKTIKSVARGNGWFYTGDIGKINENQYLTVLGRRDAMFQSGGENIYPEVIEKAICKFDFLDKAIVVPITNEEFGMRPVAFIKMRGNKKLDEKALEKFLIDMLPKYEIPDAFLEMPDFVQEENGYIDRKFFKTIAEEKLLDAKVID